MLSPHTPEGYRLVPPSAHITGICARTDIERGVHKAPGNEVIRGIVTCNLNDGRKPLSHTLSKGEHDIMKSKGVNGFATSAPTAATSECRAARL